VRRERSSKSEWRVWPCGHIYQGLVWRAGLPEPLERRDCNSKSQWKEIVVTWSYLSRFGLASWTDLSHWLEESAAQRASGECGHVVISIKV
jgi:hypothetical protein